MFAYLFFFRMTNHFGIPLPSGHTNMIQMILTLKVRILCKYLHHSHSKTLSTRSLSDWHSNRTLLTQKRSQPHRSSP